MSYWDAIAIVILSMVAGYETFRAAHAYLYDILDALAAAQPGKVVEHDG